MSKNLVLQGNIIVAKAALAAGCSFYGSYPITPSSEIAAFMSNEMPAMDRVFIQMEDEIASLGACIGASLTGRKSMTATSGPGFSLMQEHLGMAAIAEVPVVVVNVMRAGPSTGLPTKPSQGDMMQTKWGTHGDHPIIVVYPAFGNELYTETIRAFNLSEKYMTPVVLLLDGVIAKASENVEIPDESEIEIYENKKSIVDGNIYDRNFGEAPPRMQFCNDEFLHIESLEHGPFGYPTADPKIVDKMQNLRMEKINQNLDDIIKYNEYHLEDADIMIFSFGVSARASLEAVLELRANGIKVGLFQPLTIWPFPDAALQEKFKTVKKVLTVEMNMGQMSNEIARVAYDDVQKRSLLKFNGVPISPEEIIKAVKEF